VTRESYEEFHPLCPNVVYLTNPVNMDRFPVAENPRHAVASWNGNARHGNKANPDVKGFKSIVQPACQLAGVKLVYAEYNTCRISPAEMPSFYRKGSVALCASAYEGASNSVMEAMAAGQAVISTPVGNIVEMRESQLKHLGDTGIVLVDRTPEAFAAALRGLAAKPERMAEMGQINRVEIAARWSWGVWAERYEKFLRMAL
jgi:glycosyltransferase involved in cell wall biosynthesis